MQNPANKPVIAIDVDEVLAINAEGFVEYSNTQWGTHLTLDDYHEHWGELWQVGEEETEERAIQYHTSGTIEKLKAISNAKEVLIKLSEDYRLIVLTSRRRLVEKGTRDWLDYNFPEVFDGVEFAGIFDTLAENRMNMTKADRLKQLKAEYFIDDQPRHCFAAGEAGIHALLFGDYKWNRGLDLPDKVAWVKNWQEVLEYFDGK